MKLIGRADFEEWNPDFSSSAQADPDWVRARFEQLELCNSLSEVEWGETPVQVRLCEECGQPGCGSGGYVHLSVADDVVLWTAPQVDRSDEWAVVNFAESELVRRFGALVIPADEWARWRSVAPGMPTVDQLPVLNGRALADAWRMQPLGDSRVERLDEVLPMLESRLLAADSLGKETAIDHVARLIGWFDRVAQKPLQGKLRSTADADLSVETLYFDGPADGDWPAIGFCSAQLVVALDKEWVFEPDVAEKID